MVSWSSVFARLLFAAFLGGTIGLERGLRKRPAGMRTGVCVCMGAALFTLLSGVIATRFGDTASTRIASNIVQGIGFIGAGVILRDRGSVVGLTTASTIFVEAAIGMAAGAGLYGIAGLAWGILLFALVALAWVEDRLNLKPRYMLFRISADKEIDLVAEVHRIFTDLKIALDNFQISTSDGRHLIQFDADVSYRQQERILAQLIRPGVTCEILPVERQRE